MNIVDINEIKSVIICFDWERMIIPRDYVKCLEYDDKKNGENVILEVDLDYIKNHKYFMGNDLDSYQKNNIESDSNLTIWERLQGRNVWFLEVVYEDETVHMKLPSNRKDFYCHESQYIMPWDAINVCEVHSTDGGVFKIVWSKNDVYMNEEELKLFLANDNLSEQVLYGVAFGVRLVENLYKDKLGNLTNIKLEEKHKRIDNLEINVLTLNQGREVNLALVTNEEDMDIIHKVISEDKSYWILILNDNMNDKKDWDENVAVTRYSTFNKFWLDFKDDNLL